MESALQLQDDFSGASLSTLSGLGLEVYALIPSFRERCPLCAGVGCAVRHGLYFRGVVERSGRCWERFGVPRFRCRRRGPSVAPGADVTFSVLPAALVPRRRWSLALLRWLVDLVVQGVGSVPAALDALAALGEAPVDALTVEPVVVYRALHLFAGAYRRLRAFPVAQVELEHAVGLRRQGAVLAAALVAVEPRGPPLVLRFHRQYFPRLLFDLPVR